MDINELASKVDGEIVGGRLVAVVDGKKQYLTAVGDKGVPFLNELGLKISNELSFAEPVDVPAVPEVAEVVAPKAKRRKAEPAEVDAVPDNIELDI